MSTGRPAFLDGQRLSREPRRHDVSESPVTSIADTFDEPLPTGRRPMLATPMIAGLVLAGGRGTRMGTALPKPLVRLGGRPLLAYVLDAFPAGVAPVVISANEPEAFAAFGLPVVADRVGGFAGPLAGLDAAAAWLAERHPDIPHLLVLPGDTPFLPADLASRMTAAPCERPRVARYRRALQPTVALWPMAALAGLPAFLERGERLSIRAFLETTGFDPVDFPETAGDGEDDGARDPFQNVNTPADLAAARRRLRSA